MTNQEIEALAKWGAAKEVPTKKGPRLCRKARDTQAFAALWERKKDLLYSMGLVRKRVKGRFNADGSEKFELLWWSLLPPEIVLARQQSLQESHAADAEVEIPVPTGLAYLGYQKAGIVYASKREGTLIADEMGLGKTIQAIGMVNFMRNIHRVLVICPAHLKIKWYRELRKWLVRDQSVGMADGKCFPTTDVVIINFQILHKWPKKLEFFWDLVVVDEAHELRNPKARRTQLVLGYSPSRVERKKGMLPTSGIPSKYKLMLSGTPMANKPYELFPLIHWLAPKVFVSKWDFAARYCGWVKGKFGTTDGCTNEGELGERLRSVCMIRRLKKDVLKELPAKRREVIELPADKVIEANAENEALNRFIGSLATMKANVELAKATGNLSRYQKAVDDLREGLHDMNSKLSVIRRETAMAKAPFVVEHLKGLIDEGNKVILFAFHRDVVHEYWGQFKGAVMVRGGMTDREKMQACDAFQNNEACKLIVGNMSAMGTGLDLTAGNVVVFAEESWLPLEISQCEDRAHRIGQLNSVFVQHIVLEGSIDCQMAYETIRKQEIFERIMDSKTLEQVKQEPIIPMPDGVSVTLKQVNQEAASITPEQLRMLNRAVQVLERDAEKIRGFNLIDREISRHLAGLLQLSAMQGVLVTRLVRRYRAHLPPEVIRAFPERAKAAPAVPATVPPPPMQITPPVRAVAPVSRVADGQQLVLL